MSRSVNCFALALVALLATAEFHSTSLGSDDEPGPANERTTVEKADAAPSQAVGESTPVERALSEQVDLKFKDMPLKDVADAIAAKTGVNVLLDRKAVTDAGDAEGMSITFGVGPISLRSALRLMLSEHDLDFLVDSENVLLITSATAAKEHVIVQAYDVHDFATPVHKFSGTESKLDELIDIVTSIIAPTTWDKSGGTGSISPFGTQLVVSQTEEIQEQIADLRSALRDVRDQPKKFMGAGGRAAAAASISEAKIIRTLQTLQDFDFHEAPLNDVAETLRQRGIPVHLDLKAVTEAGQSADTPFTFKAKQLKLESALRLMLKDFDLSYIIDHDVLVITSATAAKEHVTIGVYPVGDLIGDMSGKSSEEINQAYQQLIDAVTSTVAPTTWSDVGGTGSIKLFPFFNVLICSQTREGHDEVADLLAKLRAVRKTANESAAAKTPAKTEDAMVVRIHHVFSANDAAALDQYIAAIRTFVEPESWRSGSISKVPRAIIVRNTPAVQQQISNLIAEFEGTGKRGGGGFGGGGRASSGGGAF